jgi:hypothetical protein
LFRADQKIAHVTFPEYGIASVEQEGAFVSDQKPNTSKIRQAIVSRLICDVDHPCISIANVLHRLRKTLPLDEHTDRELKDFIALIAVDAGFAIEFDGSARALKARQDHLEGPQTNPARHRLDPPPSAPSPKLPQVFRFSFEDCRHLLMTEMCKHYRDATFQIRERRAAEKVGSGAFCQLVNPLDLTPTNLIHRLTSQHLRSTDRGTA